jgi:hypothetical protein
VYESVVLKISKHLSVGSLFPLALIPTRYGAMVELALKLTIASISAGPQISKRAGFIVGSYQAPCPS